MAALVNEHTQRLIDAKSKAQTDRAKLMSMESEEGSVRAQINALLAVLSDGKRADGTALTATEVTAEQGRLAALEAQRDAFAARLAAQRKIVEASEAAALTAEKELAQVSAAASAEAARLAASPSGRVQVNEPNAMADPKKGFASHKDFLSAVMDAGRFGRVDERLKMLASLSPKGPQAAQGSDEQGVYSDPHGGFLVPHGVAPGILAIRPEDDPVQQYITSIEMSAPSVSYNARVDKNHATSVSGGFTVSRRPETTDGSSSRTVFEQITLHANEEFGLAYATESIIHDSPQSFISIIAAGFADEFVSNAMKERLIGTGSGERMGILRSPAKITVAKETGQGAATIKKENIDKMMARCWKPSRAIWLANHNTRPQLRSLVQVVGTGGNSVPYFSNNPGGQEFLDGRPIFFTEYAKTVGTEGDLILCVWSEYLEGTFQSAQYAESIHVRFAAAERCFRFYRRNDGQPWWRSALEPLNGDTLSPIVVLAVRA